VTVAAVSQVTDNVFDLDLPAPDGLPTAILGAGSRVALGFDLSRIALQGGGTLLGSVGAQPFGYVGRKGDQIVVRLIPDDCATRSFVTFRIVLPQPGGPGGAPDLLAWFHTDRPLNLPTVITGIRTRGNQHDPIAFSTSAADGPAGVPTLLWRLVPTDPLQDGDLLGLVFDLTKIHDANNASLASQILEFQRSYIGWDGDRTVRAFHAVVLPAVQAAPPSAPAMPFVTVTPLPQEGDHPAFELWFHLTRGVDENVDHVVELKAELKAVSLFAELAAAEGQPPAAFMTQIPIEVLPPSRRNVFHATVTDLDAWAKAGDPNSRLHYLRFVFVPDVVGVRTPTDGDISLTKYIAIGQLRFDGQAADGRIVSYLRV
jgi:hypothetical protein